MNLEQQTRANVSDPEEQTHLLITGADCRSWAEQQRLRARLRHVGLGKQQSDEDTFEEHTDDTAEAEHEHGGATLLRGIPGPCKGPTVSLLKVKTQKGR